MNYIPIITEQLDNQNDLNVLTCGDNWTTGKTTNDKKTRWSLYSIMEICELIESTPYKHWDGKQETDYLNIKVELADTYHFILSEIITFYQNNTQNIALMIDGTLKEHQYAKDRHKLNGSYKDRILEDAEKFIHQVSSPNALKSKPEYYKKLLKAFFNLCTSCSLDFEELSLIYKSKSTLNAFRQRNGYKTNQYMKIWNPSLKHEDNHFMIKTIENNPNITQDDLYKSLESQYNKVKNEAS